MILKVSFAIVTILCFFSKFQSTDNVVSSFFATLCHVTGCSCDCRTHCCGTNSVQRWLMERGVKKP